MTLPNAKNDEKKELRRSPFSFLRFSRLVLLFFEEISDLCKKLCFCRAGRLFFGRLFGFLHLVHTLDYEEDEESDDQEIDDSLDQCTIADGSFSDMYSQSAEIYAAAQDADNRCDDVVDECSYDLTESTADDYRYSQVYHVALHREFFELFPHNV